jgi:hypothetical protein
VTTIVALNIGWALGSLLFSALGLSSPSTPGSVWIVLQALVVAAFAALQAAFRPSASPSSAAISS